jgi:hypothetical protein
MIGYSQPGMLEMTTISSSLFAWRTTRVIKIGTVISLHGQGEMQSVSLLFASSAYPPSDDLYSIDLIIFYPQCVQCLLERI